MFLALATAGCIARLFSNWVYDDPFITYRYAQNLAHGLGFVYNPGERILSTTTPFFTLLLAAFYLVWPNLPLVANVIGAASLATGAFLLWDLAHTWQAPCAGWVALGLYPSFVLALSTLGSETPLYLAFCIGAFAAHARSRRHLTAVLSALALLTRGDGVLVAGLIAADFLIRFIRERQPIPWSAIALYAGLAAPWFLFAAWYFGTPLPVTLAVKQQQGLMAISQRFAPGFLRIIGWYWRWNYGLVAALAVAGMIESVVRSRPWLVFLLWPIIYFAAYTLLGVSGYFWYYAPLVPGFIMAAGLGVHILWTALQRWQRERSIIAIGLMVLALFQVRDAWQTAQNLDSRYSIYRAVGEWLEAHTAPTASIGALEVGIIGYYAQRSMIDFAGLIQPDVAKQFNLNATYQDSARWAMARYRPDYLVLNPAWFPDLLLSKVLPACQVVTTFSGESYRYAGDLTIYQCPK